MSKYFISTVGIANCSFRKPKPKPVVEDVNEGNNATENISKNETDNVTLEDAPPNQEGRADESMPSDDLGDSEQNGSEDNTADEL